MSNVTYNPCSLYIIIKPNSPLPGHAKGVAKGNCFKIGIAGDVQQRFTQLDCHPERLDIVSEYETEGREYALMGEAIIHKLLKHKRIRGEWFYLTPHEVYLLDNMIVEYFDVEVHYHNRMPLREYELQKKAYIPSWADDPPYWIGDKKGGRRGGRYFYNV